MTRDRDVGREPCPDRIIEDMGGAFGMGCVGGFLWHFLKGARNSPRGEVFIGGLYSAKMRAPILGGNFAVWGGTFSTFDCSFQYLRGREDHWNAIASGFCTGGVLALRGGWRSASRNAFIGGVLLGIIEMVSAVLSRKTTPTPRQQFQQQMQYENMLKNSNKVNQQTSSSSTSPKYLSNSMDQKDAFLPNSSTSSNLTSDFKDNEIFEPISNSSINDADISHNSRGWFGFFKKSLSGGSSDTQQQNSSSELLSDSSDMEHYSVFTNPINPNEHLLATEMKLIK